MKKLCYTALIALGLTIFAACGDAEPAGDAFLEDFDYMMQAMEDTFPYFGLAERRLGIDIRELANETRTIIENNIDNMDAHAFWDILRHEFFDHISLLGNAQVLNYQERLELHNFYVIPALRIAPPYHLRAALIFTYPDVVRFYEEQAALFDTPAPVTIETPRRHVYTTEILEEGRIGYMHISTFLVDNFRQQNAMMDRFFRDIQHYDHLILDIRDTGHGRVDFWRMLVMHVIWPDRDNLPDLPFYTFYRGTELARELAESHLATEGAAARFVPDTELVSASDISLPHLNADDMQGLNYAIRFNANLDYLDSNQFHFAQEQMMIPRAHIPFGGQIWLLTSEGNVGASAMFARQAKYMEFATLVGETTSGGYTSTPMTHFRLPHTGILVRWDIDYITDQYGRALEEFPTTPHYFNRPGMDALQTVLEMINESSP